MIFNDHYCLTYLITFWGYLWNMTLRNTYVFIGVTPVDLGVGLTFELERIPCIYYRFGVVRDNFRYMSWCNWKRFRSLKKMYTSNWNKLFISSTRRWHFKRKNKNVSTYYSNVSKNVAAAGNKCLKIYAVAGVLPTRGAVLQRNSNSNLSFNWMKTF